MEETECSETSAYKIQTPGNYPEENIQHTEHGESLKSKVFFVFLLMNVISGQFKGIDLLLLLLLFKFWCHTVKANEGSKL
jgi:hypothetical protein